VLDSGMLKILSDFAPLFARLIGKTAWTWRIHLRNALIFRDDGKNRRISMRFAFISLLIVSEGLEIPDQLLIMIPLTSLHLIS
jgi:hypothetical protein